MSTSGKAAKPKLTKKQKAEKYGKRFTKDYLEYNRELLGGDLSALQEELERDHQVQMRLAEGRGEALRHTDYQGKGEIEKLLRGEVVQRSLAISRGTKNAEDKLRLLTAQRVKQERVNGFVTLVTSKGSLRLEVFCPIAPTAAENFLGLCERGYYKDTTFHRLIKGFMVQGGDPTRTGKGGESLWGNCFQDEHSSLSHAERGVLSMANSGPDTNGSQFFITLGACTHLDGKHTVFGQLVGGKDVLSAVEGAATSSERPVEDIRIVKAVVHFNPFGFIRKL